jgi:hypothetical protein
VLAADVPLTLSFKIRVPASRPINFYYLFDSSSSMVCVHWARCDAGVHGHALDGDAAASTVQTDDLDNVVNLARNLETTLREICAGGKDNACVKMQMGNFIDKPFNRVNKGLRVYPFWPGAGYEDGAFHTADEVNFTAAVEATIRQGRVIANSDNAEASFEALMQAIQCTDWAQGDRHNILLLTTDDVAQTSGAYLAPRSTYPTNGDTRLDYIGRYALLLSRRPEDTCYYDPAAYLALDPAARAALIANASMVTDAPTAALLKAALLARNIVPVVAAAGAASTQSFWRGFIEYVGFGRFGVLSADYSNIQTLVREAYRSLAGSVQLVPVDNGARRVLFVKDIDPPIADAQPGQTYTVNVVVEATPDTPTDITAVDDAANPPLELQVLGMGRVQVKLLARECNCSAAREVLANGVVACGVAACDAGYTGPRCQCTQATLAKECPADGNGLQCSGRGSCLCGVCTCDNATGPACECMLLLLLLG